MIEMAVKRTPPGHQDCSDTKMFPRKTPQEMSTRVCRTKAMADRMVGWEGNGIFIVIIISILKREPLTDIIIIVKTIASPDRPSLSVSLPLSPSLSHWQSCRAQSPCGNSGSEISCNDKNNVLTSLLLQHLLLVLLALLFILQRCPKAEKLMKTVMKARKLHLKMTSIKKTIAKTKEKGTKKMSAESHQLLTTKYVLTYNQPNICTIFWVVTLRWGQLETTVADREITRFKVNCKTKHQRLSINFIVVVQLDLITNELCRTC